MHPVIRGLGKILRLVGISSPEDAKAKREGAEGIPSWRKPAGGPSVGGDGNNPEKG